MTFSPPTWTLYDRDYKTSCGTLSPLPGAFIWLKDNKDCGSGMLKIHSSDPLFSYVSTKANAILRYIDFGYRGVNPSGFFVEDWQSVEADSAEGPGQIVTLSGRSRLAILERAKVWDWQTPGDSDIRYFGVKDVVSGYGGASVPKGLMLWWLLTEARDVTANLAGQYINRYCFRWPPTYTPGTPPTPLGTIQVDWDFSATLDSLGNAWSDVDDMQFVTGSTTLLQVFQQIAALQYDVKVDFNPSTGFMIHVYDSRQGSDLSATVILKRGDTTNKNLLESKLHSVSSGMGNAMLVKYSNPADPYTQVNDSTSQTAYGRYEGYLECANASTEATALNFGAAQLAQDKDPKDDNFILAYDGNGSKHVLTDYNAGDKISYNNGSTIPWPSTGIQLTWPTDNDPYAQVLIESSAP